VQPTWFMMFAVELVTILCFISSC